MGGGRQPWKWRMVGGSHAVRSFLLGLWCLLPADSFYYSYAGSKHQRPKRKERTAWLASCIMHTCTVRRKSANPCDSIVSSRRCVGSGIKAYLLLGYFGFLLSFLFLLVGTCPLYNSYIYVKKWCWKDIRK